MTTSLTLTHSTGAIQVPVHSKSPSETLILNTQISRAMNGTMYSHANVQQKVQLEYSLEGMDENVVHQLRDFVKTKIGDDFILFDADTSTKWKVKILTYPLNARDSGPDSSMTLTMLGVQVQ